MSVKVEIPEGYNPGRDNFIINVSRHFPLGDGLKCWSFFVNRDERWLYRCDHDGNTEKFFPVDSVEALLEWLVYCESEKEGVAA